MKWILITVFAAATQSLAAITNEQEDMTTTLVPTGDGRGVAACVSVGFDDLRELPLKAVSGLWSLIVCVTQPIHPYRYVRDDQGHIETDSDGKNKKVWLPFYRLWGEHQGDSVVGIVYDNRGTNGIAGSHWFAGYSEKGWQDKGGKLVGLALLAWGTSEALNSDRRDWGDAGDEPAVTPVIHSGCTDDPPIQEPSPETPTQVQTEPELPVMPAWPPEWEGEGGPVGR